MKIFSSDTFELPLPEGHRFPMAKYRLLRERIEDSSLFEDCQILVPKAASREQLLLVHERQYLDHVESGQLTDLEIRRIGFPWSPQMVERSRRSVGASIEAANWALQESVSVNLAGGTHHAFPDSGQGYCVFNDVAVAARDVQHQGLVERILFVDCDVHQGNGTAGIAKSDPTMFAFSIHCRENFPFRKTSSDLDIELPANTSDAEYLAQLESALTEILANFHPDLVFYVSGADAYSGDRLGKLDVSKHGLAERDELVFQTFSGLGIPVAVCMAGGYAPNVDDIVDIHFQTVLTARKWQKLTGRTSANAVEWFDR